MWKSPAEQLDDVNRSFFFSYLFVLVSLLKNEMQLEATTCVWDVADIYSLIYLTESSVTLQQYMLIFTSVCYN